MGQWWLPARELCGTRPARLVTPQLTLAELPDRRDYRYFSAILAKKISAPIPCNRNEGAGFSGDADFCGLCLGIPVRKPFRMLL
jgi:hypothetical protein